MLSFTCKMAIKAAIYLSSRHNSGENAGIKEIAECIGASEHTVGKMLQVLVKQGVIRSMKGPAGGFYISGEQMKQPVMAIVDAIDGRQVFKECGLGLSKCSATRPCPIHHEYKVARELVEQLFNTKRIEDLREPVNSGVAYLIG
ncbi:RrF2 family transcriptional regulator [Chitinophaga sancti]|uniref:Rrf2 family transcriptional regulator n=1 Tax=Chitinophaga sancti TaxID=1004 RepID=A0A1K1R7H6_9BACT|nr:Rrf2 family transcriptional regulator [Chitinophaga sancti]WQD64151.1 Rrf2 family transcriptional regulator [Chitinophaga sancti]WQG90225.1 Rrf2 family transcriptional regulator [Chitinophaga sancti]SFW67897.1 transcriptional regulator, BadM/Rrf2 family [Chitinophaga sancti]